MGSPEGPLLMSAAAEPSTDNQYTRGLGEFVAGLRYADIPAEVRDRIKLLVLDSLGCALYGARLPWSEILIRCLAQLDRSDDCAAWGTDRRFSAPHATLINGTLVQGFELDDVHRQGVLHVGAVTLPPLIAVCEIRPGMTGKDFLTAGLAGSGGGPPRRVGRGP